MGNKARSNADFWRGGCVCHVNLTLLSSVTNQFATNSVVAGLFLFVVPALQLKGRYLRVGKFIQLPRAHVLMYGVLGTLLVVMTVSHILSFT